MNLTSTKQQPDTKYDPSGFTFLFQDARSLHSACHYLEARYRGVPVGGMLWHARTGEIEQITVGPAHRRRGVATALWHHARAELGPRILTPRHSGRRTPAGDAWAHSTGDPVPAWTKRMPDTT